MEKKQTIAPNYYKQFKCIGGNCEDTCCAGWYLPVDEATYKKYKKVKDAAMKKRLDKELVAKKGGDAENAAKIKLKNNRCAFLSGQGWCDIYTTLGENYLSKSCTLYPRTGNQMNDKLEYSLTLSCPEAARCVLLSEEGIRFEPLAEGEKILTINGEIKLSTKPQTWKDYFVSIRGMMIKVLQNRSLSFEERMCVLEEMMQDLERVSGPTQYKKIPEVLKCYDNKLQAKPVRKQAEENISEARQMMALVETLMTMREGKKWPSERYEQCYDWLLEGLGQKEGKDFKEGERKYQAAKMQYVMPFIEDHAYLLENYFVNYVFERLAPLEGNTPMASFEWMKLYYRFIQLHLVGMAAVHKGLSKEDVVMLVQCFTRVFDHNELYRQKLAK